MTHHRTLNRGLFGLLLASAAIPAVAQETVTPPTITPPAAPPVAEPAAAPAPAATPTINFAPQAPVVQTAPPPAPPPESVRNPAPDATETRPARRAAAPAQRAAPAPRTIAAAPVAAPIVAPAATASPTPAPEAAPVVEEPAIAPAAAAPAPAQTEDVSSTAAWAILGLAIAAIIGGIAFLLARRRRRTVDAFDYDEPVYEPVAEPVAAAPALVPEALAVASDPAQRPWIDIGLRPIRAEAEGALQVEVTVSNSGDVDAHDVRVSTWMLNSADSSAGEQALIEARSDAQVATVDVAPGADRSVDTTLAMPGETASPILVAEARYPLPDGGEGRIAATFEIDVNGTPESVEARLHDVLERA